MFDDSGGIRTSGGMGGDFGGAGLISGIASVGASIYNTERNISNANALNRSAQRFAKHMSSTAHTREVADLRNAGLNPILSATGGQGAATPTLGLQMGQSEVNVEGLRQAAVTAAELKQMDKALQEKDANISLAKAAEKREEAVAEFNRANTKTVDSTRPAAAAEAKVREKSAKALESTAGATAILEKALGIWRGK